LIRLAPEYWLAGALFLCVFSSLFGATIAAIVRYGVLPSSPWSFGWFFVFSSAAVCVVLVLLFSWRRRAMTQVLFFEKNVLCFFMGENVILFHEIC
jgi:hypothetical protein